MTSSKQVTCEQLSERFNQNFELNKEWVSRQLKKTISKIDLLLEKFSDTFPSANTEDGIYHPVEKVDWTEGFWIGILWLCYEATLDDKYRIIAENFIGKFEKRIDENIKTNTHDLGFLYILSCVNAYKITKSEKAKIVAIKAADKLLERYNESSEIIQAWGDLSDPARQGRMIVDCNLNVPLLFWATEITGEKKYSIAATKHLHQAKEYLVRADASTYHTYYFDITSGLPKYGNTHQGYSDDSCWARGQAWAIYGFSLAYEYTKDKSFIDITRSVTNYFLNRLPDDYVCYWDLIFSASDNQYKDTSANAIAICGIDLFLNQLPKTDGDYKKYLTANYLMLSNLSEKYFSDKEDCLLNHGVYNYPRNMGIDEGNLWGDYFYLESLVRLNQTWNKYW